MAKRKNNKRRNKNLLISLVIVIFILAISYSGENTIFDLENIIYENTEKNVSTTSTNYEIGDIPEYSGEIYIEINNNIPYFEEDEYTTEAFEQYSELDDEGRCGVAYANICQEIMPQDGEERGDISSVKPTGWVQAKYDGEYLYNRCHLIGYQLANENANELNLITGTRYFNVSGMLPFENEVADYVNNSDEDVHVLYRVTPIFEGDNLVATGVEIEAYSVEDEGEGVCFNVFVYNVQPGVTIDYATGESWSEE